MIHITPHKLLFSDSVQVSRLCNEFTSRHCVVFPEFFSAPLLRPILDRLETSHFYGNQHEDNRQRRFATDLTMVESELVLHFVHFVLNNPALFENLQRITGCDPIGSFGGRIYRSLPAMDHRLDWHDDTDASERLLGISINLSPKEYVGGVFQLREKASGRIITEVKHDRPGDAHIFRISPQLQHRVTAVEGISPRTAAAGWFLSAPDRRTALRSLVSVDSKTTSN
jgi:hypothetical protein